MTKHFKATKKKALNGDPKAQFNLAAYYFRGKEVKKDDAKAAELFRQAAEQGHTKAQYELAKCYFYGIGVKTDYNLTFHYCSLAAEKGLATAEFFMGYLNENGIAVEKDFETAKTWFLKAAYHRHIEAAVTLEIGYGCRLPEDMERSPDLDFIVAACSQLVEDDSTLPADTPADVDSKGRTKPHASFHMLLRHIDEII